MVVSYVFEFVLETKTVRSTLYDKLRHLTRFHDSNRQTDWMGTIYKEVLTKQLCCDVVAKEKEVTVIGTNKGEIVEF